MPPAPRVSPGTLDRLRIVKGWVLTITSGMGTSSPAEVLANLIRILEGASPRLRLAIALLTPWAMLGAAVASYAKVWRTLCYISFYIAGSIYASVRIYSFWWRGNRITLRQESREYEERDSRGKYHVVQAAVADVELSCFSLFAGAKPLQDFLRFVQNIPTKERTTTIYRPQSTAWDAGVVQSARNLNAVTMKSSIKDDLVKDVDTYLAPATKKYYANRGIPYRRGFLFYGPPGTGKTSFANAIAGHFTLNVYMISLSTKTLSDDMLESLFEQLPNKCIVLLEDIDSAGIRRETMRQKRKRARKARLEREMVNEYGEPIVPPPTGITLSGLLNVLDGIHSREGMITIMTSNTPDSLDPALVRPGRIDRKVLFSYASREVSAKLFRHIFEKTEEERIEGEPVGHGHDIAALAGQFAHATPADKLTPGDVQGFLLVHRADPVAAVAEARAWAHRTLEIKSKGANVAAFEGAASTDSSTNPSPTIKVSDAHDSAQEDDDDGNDDTTSEDTISPGRHARQSLPASFAMPPSMGGLPFTGSSGNTVHWSSAYPVSTPGYLASHPVDYRGMMHQQQASLSNPWLMSGGLPGPGPQATPPYSRAASRSPPTTDGVGSERVGSSGGAGDEGGNVASGKEAEGEKGGDGEK